MKWYRSLNDQNVGSNCTSVPEIKSGIISLVLTCRWPYLCNKLRAGHNEAEQGDGRWKIHHNYGPPSWLSRYNTHPLLWYKQNKTVKLRHQRHKMKENLKQKFIRVCREQNSAKKWFQTLQDLQVMSTLVSLFKTLMKLRVILPRSTVHF